MEGSSHSSVLPTLRNPSTTGGLEKGEALTVAWAALDMRGRHMNETKPRSADRHCQSVGMGTGAAVAEAAAVAAVAAVADEVAAAAAAAVADEVAVAAAAVADPAGECGDASVRWGVAVYSWDCGKWPQELRELREWLCHAGKVSFALA